jgi:thioredoxin 1
MPFGIRRYRAPLDAAGKFFAQRGNSQFEIEERILMSTAVTESTFDQEVLSSDKPVIVDFWAEWCGPCHAVSPVLDRIVEERSDELRLVKVNIDEEQGLAERYGIASIPTIVLFKDGEPAAAAIGAQPKSAIEKQLGLQEVAA